MSSVTLTTATITRARDLFLLYSKKAAFAIEEYSDVHSVFKRLTEALESAKGGSAEVTENDVKYIISAINVCANRTPIEVQNYAPIAELENSLKKAIEESADAEEKSSITEL